MNAWGAGGGSGKATTEVDGLVGLSVNSHEPIAASSCVRSPLGSER